MKKLLIAFMVFTTTFIHAIESEITVLGLYLHDADIGTAAALLDNVRRFWPTAGGVPVKLLNAGIPVFLPVVSTGSYWDRFDALDDTVVLYRGTADVVIVFTGGDYSGNCGIAPQYNWTDFGFPKLGFLPNSQGIDTAGNEHSYIALVGTTGQCDQLNFTDDMAAHEFGHLFGAGHMQTAATMNAYLFFDSHSTYAGGSTIMVPHTLPYTRQNQYSNNATGVARNRNTLNITAKSVANYRTDDCSLSAPTDVKEVYTGCWGVWSQYYVYWKDSCPGKTSFFEWWGAQPVYMPYSYLGSGISTASYFYVNGAAGKVKVKACDSGANCSSKSESNAYLIDICQDW